MTAPTSRIWHPTGYRHCTQSWTGTQIHKVIGNRVSSSIMRVLRRQRIRKKGMRADISGVRAVMRGRRRARALRDRAIRAGGKGYISVGDKARNYGLVAFEKGRNTHRRGAETQRTAKPWVTEKQPNSGGTERREVEGRRRRRGSMRMTCEGRRGEQQKQQKKRRE